MRPAQSGRVVEHDVHALLGIVAAVDPAHQRRLHELDRGLVVRGVVVKAVGVGPQRILEHGRAHVVPVDDVQVLGLVELAGVGVDRLEHLGVLVVDHRLGGVDLAADQGQHVEVLLHQLHVAVRVEPVLAQPGQKLELVAEAPVAHRAALQVGDRGDARVGEGHLQGGAALEHLGDVGDVDALFSWHQAPRHPRHREVGRAGVQHRGRHDLHASLEDLHVQPVVLVDAGGHGRVVARELRLGEPLQLQRDVDHFLRDGLGFGHGFLHGRFGLGCGRLGLSLSSCGRVGFGLGRVPFRFERGNNLGVYGSLGLGHGRLEGCLGLGSPGGSRVGFGRGRVSLGLGCGRVGLRGGLSSCGFRRGGLRRAGVHSGLVVLAASRGDEAQCQQRHQ